MSLGRNFDFDRDDLLSRGKQKINFTSIGIFAPTDRPFYFKRFELIQTGIFQNTSEGGKRGRLAISQQGMKLEGHRTENLTKTMIEQIALGRDAPPCCGVRC